MVMQKKNTKYDDKNKMLRCTSCCTHCTHCCTHCTTSRGSTTNTVHRKRGTFGINYHHGWPEGQPTSIVSSCGLRGRACAVPGSTGAGVLSCTFAAVAALISPPLPIPTPPFRRKVPVPGGVSKDAPSLPTIAGLCATEGWGS